MGLDNRIANLLLFEANEEEPADESPIEEVERNLGDMTTSIDLASSAVRECEDWQVASLLDLLSSHVKNIRAKIGVIREFSQGELKQTAPVIVGTQQ